MFFETVKFVESTTRTLPDFVCFVGCMLNVWKAELVGESGPPSAAPRRSAPSGGGTGAWKIQRPAAGSCDIALSTSLMEIPQFFERTSCGVWTVQSEISVVSSSEKSPWSKTSKNSQPSGSRPCSEWGTPAGKYQRSPLFT